MVDKTMDVTKLWDYRVVRRESEDGEAGDWYSVQEVYYDEDGTPMAQTLDLQVEQDTITGMRTQLESMLKALDNPVLDESDIADIPVNTKTMEDRVLMLEIENAEMRDRLSELDNEFGEKIRENMKNLKTGKRTTLEGVPSLPRGTLYHSNEGIPIAKGVSKPDVNDITDEDIERWKKNVKRGGRI